MAKIVIIAPADVDLDDAVKLLKAAGNDVDVEEPTPKSLLHITLGLFSASAYGFGPGYAMMPVNSPPSKDPKDDPKDPDPKDDKDDPTDDDSDDGDKDSGDDGASDFSFEGLTVDGQPISAVKVNDLKSTLVVESLTYGPKTTYQLNESTFSFWPDDQNNLTQRVQVSDDSGTSLQEVRLVEGDKTELRVGKDLWHLFEVKQAGVLADYEALKDLGWKRHGSGKSYQHDTMGRITINNAGHWFWTDAKGAQFEGSTIAGLKKTLKNPK